MFLWILDCSLHITVDSCCSMNHSGMLLFDESHWILVVTVRTIVFHIVVKMYGLPFLHFQPPPQHEMVA
ncbi:hypothetical protein Hanom_Chr12g01179941 [Helianthus anomalus]